MQGSDMQGSDMQGSVLQGSDMQGSDMQGAQYGDSSAADATINGTALSVWRQLRTFPITFEERRPDRICTWNARRTILHGCTLPISKYTPSPLAGSSFSTRFRRPDGTTVTARLRIGASTSSVGAVTRDTTIAMYDLAGHASAASCSPVSCGDGRECRKNCDLWTYDVDILTPEGEVVDLCPPNQRAIAIPATYDENGTFTPQTRSFTFACTNGTIAKCTRWGYRPFGSATKSNGVSTALGEYHQSCVRAAMADYCSNGHSFTRDGTLVDIWDYEPKPGAGGLIPRTKAMVAGKTSGLLLESTFDHVGAREIEFLRYQELTGSLGSLDDPEVGCPGRFGYSSTDDVGLDWKREGPRDAQVVIQIDSSTGCAHSELVAGKWLSKHCSTCAFEVSDTPGYEYCTDPASPRGWDHGCVQRAQSGICAPHLMLPHSECTAGPSTTQPLDRYATGCTMLVCRTNPSCCAAGGDWTSACVSAANSLCPRYTSNGWSYPFCGFPTAPPGELSL